MKLKHKVNVDNIPDEYKSLVKPEMTNNEISQLGVIVAKQKLSAIKNKIYWWKHERKVKKKSRKKI